jgi:hypothetical protein
MKGKNVGKTRAPKSRLPNTRVISVFQPLDKNFTIDQRQQSDGWSEEEEARAGDIVKSFGTRYMDFARSSHLLERPVANEMGTWPFAGRMDLEKQKSVFHCESSVQNSGRFICSSCAVLQILNYALYPSAMCVKPEISQMIWFKYLFVDEACMYLILVAPDAADHNHSFILSTCFVRNISCCFRGTKRGFCGYTSSSHSILPTAWQQHRYTWNK